MQNRWLAVIFLLLLPALYVELLGQENDDQEIEIIQADALKFSDRNDTKSYLLTGNVILKQADTRLFCDSAYLYTKSNSAAAYGKVHINQGDTVHVYSDSALYNGNEKITTMYSNVRLVDREMNLTTDYLVYNTEQRFGIYSNGGTLKSNEAVLTSKTGYYYAGSQVAFFKDSVRLNHPQYKLEADTLEYNTETETAWFHGPTTIYNDESTVFCNDGYYETISGIAVFNVEAKMDNPPQLLKADSIYYNRETGIGKAYGNIYFEDTAQHILQYGEFALYDEVNNIITSPERSVAGYVLDDDTLFITGDTITIIRDSLERNTMTVYPNVKLFKSDFQGVCDSLFYSDVDSMIQLYYNPVLWSDETQFTGDTILLQLKNSNLDKMYFLSNAFIVNMQDSLIYNQVKGRDITGVFKDGDLSKVEVRGNGESIYYGKDDNDRYLGANKALCSDIDMYIKEKQFSKISFMGMPEATFYPMTQIDLSSFYLDNFVWEGERRPKNRQSLFDELIQDASETSNPIRERSSQKEG